MNGNRKTGRVLAILAVTGLGIFAVGCGESSNDAQDAIDNANQQVNEIQDNVNKQLEEANQQTQEIQDEARKQLEEAQKQIDEGDADATQKQLDEIKKQIEGAVGQ